MSIISHSNTQHCCNQHQLFTQRSTRFDITAFHFHLLLCKLLIVPESIFKASSRLLTEQCWHNPSSWNICLKTAYRNLGRSSNRQLNSCSARSRFKKMFKRGFVCIVRVQEDLNTNCTSLFSAIETPLFEVRRKKNQI